MDIVNIFNIFDAKNIPWLLGFAAVIANICIRHGGKKRQSTVDFYNSISTDSYKIYNIMQNKTVNLAAIKADKELEEIVHRYFGGLERLAVGANNGIYDFKILNQMCGKYLITVYAKFQDYIKERRESEGYPYYSGFEELVKKLKAKPAEKDSWA